MRKVRDPLPSEVVTEELPPPRRGPDAIDRLIDRLGPEAVCAALAPMLTEERIAIIDRVLAARLGSVIPVVEDVYDPLNGAAVIRTAEAFGLQELHVVEPGVRFQAARGITRGCHRWIDLVRWRDAQGAIEALRGRGFRVLATGPDARHSVDDVAVDQPVAILFGNERHGLTPRTAAACDETVSLPMYGFTQSFNLSVSAALALQQLASRRRSALGGPGDLAADRVARLRARWFALKIRGAVGVVERIVAGGTHQDVAPGPRSRDNPGSEP
ncbi:MAG TPA: RNA methyltransferase [Kofleriaceae bacterium]|nr:RNA methyltransferase [Kofleriaceae bacterium]